MMKIANLCEFRDTNPLDLLGNRAEIEVSHVLPVPETAPETPTFANVTVIDLFEQRAKQHPARIAVEQQGKKLSYQQLNACCSHIARLLMQAGVKQETLVAICMERTVEMIAGILGILKAGGAYLPLDPKQPRQRMDQILSDSQSPVILTQRSLLAQIPETSAQVLFIEDLLAGQTETPANLSSRAKLESLAYVIFTSGSTGRPKGVAIEHRALSHFVVDAVKQYGITEHDRVLQFASLAFDAHVEELFSSLISGATLVLRTDDMIASYENFLNSCEALEISVISLPTAFWHELTSTIIDNALKIPSSIKIIMLGGEELLASQVKAWFKVAGPAIRLINTYGPTEATVVATVSHIDPKFDAPRVPIGRAMGGKTAYVLDANRQCVPPGVAGELYLGGEGLARGYLHQAGLTADKFIPDPFSSVPGARLYRTGDCASWRDDGELDFLGRMDRQVKLRGYRIELGEIENALSKVPGVRNALVMLRGENSIEKQLVGYIIPDKAAQINPHNLREALQQTLPDYMIPTAYVFLAEMPLNLNGKVDRNALPAPDDTVSLNSDYVGPRDEMERGLVKIWTKLLRHPRIGIHDNYFDLGGHSLLAVRLFSEIGKWTGRFLPLATLLQAPTIAQLAEVLKGARHESIWPVLVPIQPCGTKPALFCIHGIGGNVLGFETLARQLGTEQPMYGLQARGLDSRTAPHTRIEDMAADYIREMRAFQPDGPYHMLGQSFGGLVAFEMARQLRAQGAQVGFVGLLDTMTDHSEINWSLHQFILAGKYQYQRMQFHWKSFRNLPLSKITVFLGQKIRTLSRRVTSRLWQIMVWFKTRKTEANKLPKSLWNVREACWLAAKNYKPPVDDLKITLFRAEERSFGDPDEIHAGWVEFALGGVEAHAIPGDHDTILNEPNVRSVSIIIQECLAKVEKNHC